jgi:hypothetical protein
LDLDRVLTKLRYDELVSGYALITNDGYPFLSFGLPEDTLPQIQGTLRIHSSSLRMMNVMTGIGVVILARIDPNWVLGVLFKPEETLGMALQKCRDVVRLLEDIQLPPPPDSAERNEDLIMEFSPDMIADYTSQESVEESTAYQSTRTDSSAEVPAELIEEIPLDEVFVEHGCIVQKDERFEDAINMKSALNTELVDTLSQLAVDILFLVDEERTVFKIAESSGRQVERVIEVIKHCISKRIVKVECPKEQESGRREIVELPLFEGEISKAKKTHRDVLELCDGTRTVHEIAEELGILYFNALQSIVPYRGKTLRFIRKDIVIDE